MNAGDARPGRRDNGLVAAEYAAAGDVDPRVGEHLLDVLALHGIAAYLRPTIDVHPVTRTAMLPGRPTDRLYVDRAHLATARDYLARLADEADPHPPDPATAPGDPGSGTAIPGTPVAGTPTGTGTPAVGAPVPVGGPPPGTTGADRPDGTWSLDDEWARIIAGFDEVAPRRSWPEAEDLPETETSGQHQPGAGPGPGRPDHGPPPPDRPARNPPEAGGATGTVAWPPRRDRAEPQPVPAREPSLLDGLDTFGAGLPDPDQDRYVPPNPPPVPRPSLPTALAVAGIVLGLVVFLKPSLLPVAETVAMMVGFGAVVGGFATLVWRLRPGNDDDDPGDGAVV